MPDFGVKTALSEFGKAVEGKKFRNPETGNEVLFVSLPMDEQHRLYEEWLRSKNQQEHAQPGKPDLGERVVSFAHLAKGDQLTIVHPKGTLSFRVKYREADRDAVMLAPVGHKGQDTLFRARDFKKVEVYRRPKEQSAPKPEVPKKDHWKPVAMDDIFDRDYVVYEHGGKRHMGVVVRVEGPAKASKFWVTPVNPETGKPLDPSRRHSFDAEDVKERKAVLVPAQEAPGPKLKAPEPKQKELSPEEKAKIEKEREEAKKKRQLAVEEMGKTGKPLKKVSDVEEGDVISYQWKGDVFHGRVIGTKSHEFYILPIDPKTGKLTHTSYDTFRAHDLRDTDAHKVDAEHVPEDPRHDNAVEIFKSLKPLKEDPALYFHQPKESQLVELSRIVPSKIRLKGVMNGNSLLAGAASGKGGKRDPISLVDNGDGTYTVRDGNSTYTNARVSQWEKIPAIVKTEAEWEEHEKREKERKEQQSGFWGPLFNTTHAEAPKKKPAAFEGPAVASTKDLSHGDLFGYEHDGRWYVGRVLGKKSDGTLLVDSLPPGNGKRTTSSVVNFDDGDLKGRKAIRLKDYVFSDEGKKDEGKKDEGKKDEGKKDEGKKDEGKKDEGKKDEGKKDEDKKDEDKKDEDKKDEDKKDEDKKDEGKKDEGKKDKGKKDKGKKDKGKKIWPQGVTSRPAPKKRPKEFEEGRKVERIEDIKKNDLVGYQNKGRWYVGRILWRRKGEALYYPLHPYNGRLVLNGTLMFHPHHVKSKEMVLLDDYEFPEQKAEKRASLVTLRSVLADLRTAYRSGWQEWPGYKTLVDDKSQKGIFPQQTESTDPSRGQSNLDATWPVHAPQPREKERALPLPSNHDRKRDKQVGPTQYNKNRRTPPRTLSVPGEDYGHPTKYDYNYVRRRDGVTALDEGDDTDEVLAALEERVARLPLPKPSDKQKNLSPTYARVMRQWYLRNKNRKKVKERLQYKTRGKRDPQSKRYRGYYRLYPQRYKRRGRSPFADPAERTKAWREEQKQEQRETGLTPSDLKERRERKPSQTLRTRGPTSRGRRVYAHAERLAEMLELLAANWPADWNTHVKKTKPPEQLDQNHAPSNPPGSVPRSDPGKQQGESGRAPDLDAKPQVGLKWKVKPPASGGGYPIRTVQNPSGGSGKVIPMEWYTQEVNNTQALPDSRQDRYLRNNNDVRVASTLDEILSRCDGKIKERSKEYAPKLERTDTKNWIWHWKVGKYAVRVQAFERGRAKSFSKLNLRVSCSCPFWRWWGPAHWASREDYQRGQPPGTASYPEVRDPTHWRPVCKHAYAVLEKSRRYFVRPDKNPLKKLGSRFSFDSPVAIEIVGDLHESVARVVRASEERDAVRRLVRRYVGREES